MKGIRFYEEMKSKRKGESTGNVVALFLDNDGRPFYAPDYSMMTFAALYDHANSQVASTGISREFLEKTCKRISERRAREVHQAMFERLDRED